AHLDCLRRPHPPVVCTASRAPGCLVLKLALEFHIHSSHSSVGSFASLKFPSPLAGEGGARQRAGEGRHAVTSLIRLASLATFSRKGRREDRGKSASAAASACALVRVPRAPWSIGKGTSAIA